MVLCMSSPLHIGVWGLRGLEGVARSARQYPHIQPLWQPSPPLLVSPLDPTQHNRWLLRQRQRRCSKQSLVILGRIGKSWEVSQSLLVILKMHFIGSFAITVLPQVVARARTTLSPLFLGNDLPYLIGWVLGEYPEQSNGGTTHVLAARGQERAQLGQDVLSNHLGLDVCWCGKTKEVGGVHSTAGSNSGSDSNSWLLPQWSN